jgi:hypothetical protein
VIGAARIGRNVARMAVHSAIVGAHNVPAVLAQMNSEHNV